jgi:hypothetical protein
MFIITSWMGYYNMHVQRKYHDSMQAIQAQIAQPGQQRRDDHDDEE